MTTASSSTNPLKSYELLNSERTALTAEKLLSFPGCEHYTPEQAEAIVISIQKLVAVFLEWHRVNSICIDSQQIVNLNEIEKNQNTIPLQKAKSAA